MDELLWRVQEGVTYVSGAFGRDDWEAGLSSEVAWNVCVQPFWRGGLKGLLLMG